MGRRRTTTQTAPPKQKKDETKMNRTLKALQKKARKIAKASPRMTYQEAEDSWEQYMIDKANSPHDFDSAVDDWEAPDDWYEFDSAKADYWWNDGQQAHPTRAELIKAPRNKRKERLARTLAFIIGAGTTALVIVAVTPLT